MLRFQSPQRNQTKGYFIFRHARQKGFFNLNTKDYSTNTEILQDVSYGKTVPWRSKKVKNTALSDSYKRLGDKKKSLDIKACACLLAFEIDPETASKQFKSAIFCQKRLCPMCQWRKSLKVFRELSKVMDLTQERNKNFVPVFLTLTVKNCKGEELSEIIGSMLRGWRNLNDHRRTRKIIKGWFRALEVTYNRDDDTYHPHIHAILLVEKSYFKSADYMQTADWVQLWRTSVGLDYDPICDIRAVKTAKGKRKEVAEVAKYTLKDTEYLTTSNALTDKLVAILDGALYRRRLYAYGGILKKIAKELKVDKPEETDLNIDEDTMRADIATVLEFYKWNFGLGNYVKHDLAKQ